MAEFGVKPTRVESIQIISSAFEELNDTYWLNPQLTNPLRDEIIDLHTGEFREHHGINHPAEMILFADKYTPVSGLKVIRGSLLIMILGHDSIQKAGTPDPDNVAASRELTVEKFSYVGVPQPTIVHAAAGIDATANHDTGVDDDTIAFFLDDDMSIIGMSEERYDEYADDIEKEFGWVKPLEVFLQARKDRFLDEFLKRQRLFNTDFAHQLFDTPARRNMGRESARIALRLSQLRQQSGE